MAFPHFSDSSSSEFTKPKTWSSFTDSDEPIHSNPPLPANLEPPAISPPINSHGSWSPCPSWSTSDWSPCPAWSSSENNSDHQDESIQSHPSNKSDKDYVPGSIFNPLMTAPNPQSETQTPDHIIQPSQAICMLLCLFNILITDSCIISNPSCQFSSLDSGLSKSRNPQTWRSHQAAGTRFLFELEILSKPTFYPPLLSSQY